jgi:hypothetical protein
MDAGPPQVHLPKAGRDRYQERCNIFKAALFHAAELGNEA